MFLGLTQRLENTYFKTCPYKLNHGLIALILSAMKGHPKFEWRSDFVYAFVYDVPFQLYIAMEHRHKNKEACWIATAGVIHTMTRWGRKTWVMAEELNES